MRTILPSLHPKEHGSCPAGPVCTGVSLGGPVLENRLGWPLRHAVTWESEGSGAVGSQPRSCLAWPAPSSPTCLGRTPGRAVVSPVCGVSEGRSVCSRRSCQSPSDISGVEIWAPRWSVRGSGQVLDSLVPTTQWVLCPGSGC